jgi:putative hemolysin
VPPDSSLPLAAAGVLLALALVALLRLSESALLAVRRPRVLQLLEEGHPGGRRLERALAQASRLLGGAQVTRRLLYLISAALAAHGGVVLARLMTSGASPWAVVLGGGIALLLLAVVLHLLVDSAPWRSAQERPEELALRLLPLLRIGAVLAAPFLTLTRGGGSESRGAPSLLQSEEEFADVVESGVEQGVLEPEKREMIGSIVELPETVARQVMVPRTEMVAAPVEAGIPTVVEEIVRTGYSRLPVYEETADHVVGIVHAKDIMRAMAAGEAGVPVGRLMREPHFVPETKPLDDLLTEMRAARQQIAIVVDEYGGTAGIITIEDILEEIVGEIRDEYDVEEARREEELRAMPGECVLDARTPIRDVNEQMGLALTDEEYDTIGGYVFGLFGRVPEPGERIESGGRVFVVEELDGSRIARVRIETTGAAEGRDDQEAASA